MIFHTFLVYLQILFQNYGTNQCLVMHWLKHKWDNSPHSQYHLQQVNDWLCFDFQPCTVQRSAALGEKRWGGKVFHLKPWLCVRSVERVWKIFLMNLNHHKVTSHVPGKCEVCGRRFTISRNMQDHKMRHHNIYFSRYLPTLAVPMWHLGTEMSMCNQSVV